MLINRLHEIFIIFKWANRYICSSVFLATIRAQLVTIYLFKLLFNLFVGWHKRTLFKQNIVTKLHIDQKNICHRSIWFSRLHASNGVDFRCSDNNWFDAVSQVIYCKRYKCLRFHVINALKGKWAKEKNQLEQCFSLEITNEFASVFENTKLMKRINE